VKFAGVVAALCLMVLCGVGLLIGGTFRQETLKALLFGIVLLGVLSLAGNGLMNALVAIRHLRGTLAETSRDPGRRSL
jgi:hypothetical protein